jgi:hypothetical protein
VMWVWTLRAVSKGSSIPLCNSVPFSRIKN